MPDLSYMDSLTNVRNCSMSCLLGKRLLLKCPTSKVDSVVVGADMESAKTKRQSLKAAANVPGELSASIRIGGTLLAIRRPRDAIKLRAALFRR